MRRPSRFHSWLWTGLAATILLAVMPSHCKAQLFQRFKRDSQDFTRASSDVVPNAREARASRCRPVQSASTRARERASGLPTTAVTIEIPRLRAGLTSTVAALDSHAHRPWGLRLS